MRADTLIKIAADVVSRSGRGKPADDVLRSELRRRGGISRDEGGTIGRAVFAYYRWFQWLDSEATITHRINQALEINEAFQWNPQSINDQELRRAVPDWVAEQMEVST